MYDSDFMANGIEKKWWVFPEFKIEQMVTGLDLPVNLAFVPNQVINPMILYCTLQNFMDRLKR